MKKIIPLIIISILIITSLVSCASPEEQTPQKDTLTVVANIRAESLDPASGKVGDHTVNHAMYDALVKYGPDGTILPALADSWTVSEDGLTYTFKLHEGVTFHNGEAFTADDVIYTFDTYKDIPLFIRFFIEPALFVSWEKVDDTTVKFTTSLPYTKFLETMALMGQILPKSRASDPAAFEAAPVGTGPYKFESFEADGSVKLSAFDNYYLGKPVYANAVIRAPMDASTAVVALQNGEVDMIMNVPASQLPIIRDDENLELVEVSGFSSYVLSLMTASMVDQNLRKAIFHGIDTQKLIDIANEGVGEPATDFFNAKALGDLAGTVDFIGYDEALAKEYLANSSYTSDQVFTITVTAAEGVMAQSVQADLKKIGVETEIEQLDINGWATKLAMGEIPLSIYSTGGVTGSLEEALAGLSNTAPYIGNVMVSTPEFEDLIAQIRSESDQAARQELMKQALIIQYDLANQIPLFDVVSNFAHNKALSNIEPISAVTQIFYIGDFK
jgi:peptide/nickel transport system substrate-binding protein